MGFLKENFEKIITANGINQTLLGKKTVIEFDILNPITIKDFSDYIKTNNLYFYTEDKKYYPEKYKECPNCNGKRKIENSEYDRKKMDSKQYIVCTTCNGSGKVISSNEKTELFFRKAEISPALTKKLK